jgi:hypothetical protein
VSLFTRVKHYFVPSRDNAYRPHVLRRPWLLFFLAVILATEGFLVANLVARQSDETFLAAVVPSEVIALTDEERAKNNIGQLSENKLLDAAAQAKAADMAQKGYFSHTGPDGKLPWQWISQAGYHYQYAGENLAVRFVDSADVVNAWMASPTHRANIVKPVYQEIGVGVAIGNFEGQPASYVVQYFAAPAVTGTVANTPTPVEKSALTPATQAAVATTPTQTGQVEAAAIAPTTPASFTQSLVRQLIRALADPERASNWVLGASAAILIIALCCTFFMHLQVQPTNLLMSGALVAFFALAFLALNTLLAGSAMPHVEQAASVGYALFP